MSSVKKNDFEEVEGREIVRVRNRVKDKKGEKNYKLQKAKAGGWQNGLQQGENNYEI